MIGSVTMEQIKKGIVQIILVVFLVNSAYGFPGMIANNTTGTADQADLNKTTIGQGRDVNNTTASDQDIVLLQHLIEIDSLLPVPENNINIRETLIFRNVGSKDFLGTLRTWIPDGAENIMVNRSEMMTTGEMIYLPFAREGNILSWEDYVEKNSQLPFLYVVEYDMKAEAAGKLSDTGRFSKKLVYPAFINYRYMERPDLAAVVVKVAFPPGFSARFLDENGIVITPSDTAENETIFRFRSPQFKEINVEFSKTTVIPQSSQGYAVYIVLGILVILVLLYPVIKKRSGHENKTEEAPGTEDEPVDDEPSSASSLEKDHEGKSRKELEDLRKELQKELDDLETRYKAGDLLDEEYDDARTSYKDRLKAIGAKLK